MTAMKGVIGNVIRALLIAGVWGLVGVAVNVLSAKTIPWVYEPPKSLDLKGVKVPLIDEKQAKELFDNPETVFVDSRKQEDYAKSHVKGSIFLPPEGAEELFSSVEPLLPLDYRIVLYCYGPECDMAEHVAMFLARMGYKNLSIMSSGFAAWEQAGYPVEGSIDRGDGPAPREEKQESESDPASVHSMPDGVASPGIRASWKTEASEWIVSFETLM
jgi:rhodanese-related sulfurtransferase